METAIVGIAGALVGVLLTNALRFYFDWRDRKERIRDVQTALQAEIRSHRRTLEDFEDADTAATVVASVEADSSYTPFIAREIEPPIFSAIIGEIHVLPATVIDPVVVFYRQARSLAAFAEDMRGETFKSLLPQRKVQMYRDYPSMGLYALELADEALQAIEIALSQRRMA